MIAQVQTAKELFDGYERLGVVFLLLVAVVALIIFLLKLMKQHREERSSINIQWKETLSEQHGEMKDLVKTTVEAINNNSNLVSEVKTLLQSIDRRVS
jgi:hypothetical protein